MLIRKSGMTDQAHEFGRSGLGQRLNHLVLEGLVFFINEFDLYQLVGDQCLLQSVHQRSRQAFLTDKYDRLHTMGQAPQIFTLIT